MLTLLAILVILWRAPSARLRPSSTDGAAITWRQMQGPTGGKINTLLVNSQNPSTIYAGTDGGVYTSVDGAETWECTSDGLPAGREVRTLAMSNTASGSTAGPRLYAGTDAGVYRSVDGGQTWLPARGGLGERLILSLVVDTSNPTVLYAGTEAQIFKSVDGGEQWKIIGGAGLPLEPVWSLAVDPAHSDAVYAGTDSGIFFSRDGGLQWQRAGGDVPSGPLRIQALVMDSHRSSALYAATEAGIYRSIDAGVTWQAARGGLGNSIVHTVVIDPNNSELLYAAAGVQGIWWSNDAGETWEPVVGNIEELVLSLAVNPAYSRVIYAGTGRGVYYSSSAGQHWEPRNQGLRNTNVLALAGAPERPGALFATTGLDVYRTLDDGETWSSANEGFAHRNVLALAVNPASPDILYAGTWYSEIYRSQSGGRSWHLVSGALARNAPISALVVWCPVKTRPKSNTESSPRVCETLFAATNGAGVFFSSDGGAHWSAVNDGLGDQSVQVLTLAPAVGEGWKSCEPGDGVTSSANALYAGTTEGVYRLCLPTESHATESLASTDASKWAWEPVGQGLPRDEVHSLVVDEWSPNVIYAATTTSLGHIYRSVDSGDNWTAIGGGSLPTNIQVQALVLYAPRRNLSILYAATDGGIFRSEDGGQNWHAINDGLPPGANVLALWVDANRSYLYSSVKNNGVYQSVDRLPAGASLPLTVGVIVGVVALAAVAVLWARWLLQSSRRTQEQTFERNWPTWREEIRCTLQEKNGVTTEALSGIPLTFRLRCLQQYAQEHGEDGLVVRLNPPSLVPVNVAQVGGFLRNWRAVRKRMNSAAAFRPVVSRIIDQLCHLLGFTLLETRSYKRLHGYMIKAPALRLKMPPMFPIVFLQAAEPTEEDFRDLYDLMGILNVSSYLALLVVPGPVLGATRPYPLLGEGEPSPESGRDARIAVTSPESGRDARMAATSPESARPANSAGSSTADASRGARIPRKGGIREQRAECLAATSPSAGQPGAGLGWELSPQGSTDAQRLGSVQMKANLRKLASGTAHDFVVMDMRDLYRIFVAKDPEKTFVRILLGQVDLTVVSPYVTSGPVPENMFFGRDYELKTISRTIKDNSFAIVGGRKIGKTSILTKLHRSFVDAPDYHSRYLDCQAVQDYDDLCNALETMWQVTLSSHSPEGIRRLIARMRQELDGHSRAEAESPGAPRQKDATVLSQPTDGGAGRPAEDVPSTPKKGYGVPNGRRELVILLDEVDALLTYDTGNGERLFKVFRALSQEGYCRFVFCGGKVLHVRLHDPDSALFNFCNVIGLGYLSARDTGRIVVEPLQEMGIGFEDASRLVQGIIELSSCHPNVVQYICQELILRINARGDRFITQADLDAIASSTRLSDYMIEVMWGNTNALERLITLLTILERPSATLSQIEAALHARGVEVPTEAVGEALDTLVLYSVLKKEDGEYSFTAVEFPSVVAATQDVDLLVERAVQYLGRETSPTNYPAKGGTQ